MDVGLLGSGHIARALAQGWSGPHVAARERPALHFYDLVEERAADLARECGGRQMASAAQLVAAARIVVLAVRPPDVAAVLAGMASTSCRASSWSRWLRASGRSACRRRCRPRHRWVASCPTWPWP